MLPVRVVKLGGNELDRPAWLAACAAALKVVEPVVVVHGGGRAVSALSRRLGLRVEKREGRRVSPPEVAEVVEMVLAGPANRSVVAALQAMEVLFSCDVPGVCVDGVVRPSIAADEIETLVGRGVATEGMAAKLRAGARALEAGARAARIGDLQLLAHPAAGTAILAPAVQPA